MTYTFPYDYLDFNAYSPWDYARYFFEDTNGKYGAFDPFFHREWVKALRSGEFEQTQGVLHKTDTNEFCCLGVACNMEDDAKWEISMDDGIMSWKGNPYMPPTELRIKYGISAVGALADLNDENWNFSSIADAIEVQIP